MEKIVTQTLLYDFYGALLTDHQRKIYEDVVFGDLSLSEAAEDAGIRLAWQGVGDADGYEIYRKDGDSGRWQRLAEVGADARAWTDGHPEPDAQYRYCVVAWKDVDGRRAYGNAGAGNVGGSVLGEDDGEDNDEGGEED